MVTGSAILYILGVLASLGLIDHFGKKTGKVEINSGFAGSLDLLKSDIIGDYRLLFGSAGMDDFFKMFQRMYLDFLSGRFTKEQASYILATIYHETGKTFRPVREKYNSTNVCGFNSGNKMYNYFECHYGINGNRPHVARDLGNLNEGDGGKYYGRGFVQITGRKNYTNFGNFLNVDLINDPNKALEWDRSYEITISGMMGEKFQTFTGVSITNYINSGRKDYYNARRAVNLLDKASTIETHSNKFEQIVKKYW